MKITLAKGDSVCRLTFAGKMTLAHSEQLEDALIDAMRRYTKLEVDLSGVREIDHCGLHLLGLLHSIAGKEVAIVANSPIVEQASRRLLTSLRGASLARGVRREGAAARC